jgi:hypothetical protein
VDATSLLFALAGLALGVLLGRRLAERAGPGGLLTRGDAVAIAYNPAANTLRVVPVYSAGGNLYVAEGGHGLLAVPRRVAAVPLLPMRKPAFFAVGAGSAAVAVDPAALAALGIASLGLRQGSWEAEEPEKVIERLAEVAAEERGEVEVNPEFQLMIAYDVPSVVRTFLDTMGQMARSAVTAVLEASQASERIMRLWLERERRGLRVGEAVVRWLILIIIAAAFAAALLLAFHR